MFFALPRFWGLIHQRAHPLPARSLQSTMAMLRAGASLMRAGPSPPSTSPAGPSSPATAPERATVRLQPRIAKAGQTPAGALADGSPHCTAIVPVDLAGGFDAMSETDDAGPGSAQRCKLCLRSRAQPDPTSSVSGQTLKWGWDLGLWPYGLTRRSSSIVHPFVASTHCWT